MALSKGDLEKFIGIENWFRHGLRPRILFTEGAKHVADEGQAYWLLDEIALANAYQPEVISEEFQVWCLKVNLTDHTAILACEDGDHNTVYSKEILFTDFPLDEITLWFENNTIRLPSEH